jgi:integrase
MRGEGRIFERKGSAALWCAYYLRGKEYRESTGTADPEKAAKYLKRRLRQVENHKDGTKSFVGPQQERVKVSELLDALEADYKLRGKVSPQFKVHLKTVRDYFGNWRAVELTSEAVDRFITELLEGDLEAPASERRTKAPATINRSTQLLAQAYKLAIERRHLSNAPVIRHLSEGGNARQGFFGDTEFRLVVENLPDYLRDFARFGYMTGWRRGEIDSLRWEDVDGDVIRLRAENSKNGEGRTITLDGELAELIERRKTARQVKTANGVMIAALVFHHDGEPIVDFRKAWATACKMANVQGKLFHDLRRTAIRNMVRAGVPERVAMSISGHKTRSVFDRYNIVSERDLREAMQRTQEYLANAPQREQPMVIQRSARTQ